MQVVKHCFAVGHHIGMAVNDDYVKDDFRVKRRRYEMIDIQCQHRLNFPR